MISVLCPTRNRRVALEEMWQSALDTATGEVELVAVVEDDDDSYSGWDLPHTLFVGVERGQYNMSDLWNVAWREALGPIYQMGADDERFRTPGWDAIVEDAFARYPDGIVMVYGDTNTRQGFGELPFIGDAWTEAVGRFTSPAFTNNYCDTWLNDIAIELGRHVHVPILTEHLRAADGKGERDQTFWELEERVHRDNSAALYAELEPERHTEAAILRAAMIP